MGFVSDIVDGIFGGGETSVPQADPAIGKAALENAQLGKDWLAFSRDQFNTSQNRQAKLDELTNRVVQQQIATQDKNNLRADEQWQQYKNTFLPIENRVASDATNYDSPEMLAEKAAEARADVISNATLQQQANERNLASMGINPNSGRFQAVNSANDTNTALAAAGAQNKARADARSMGIMLRKDAASLGRNLTGTAAQAYGVGLNAGNSATGNQVAANNAYNANNAQMNQGFAGAINANNSTANNLTSLYNSQLNGWNAQQQASAADAKGFGDLVGTGLQLYSAFSSKKLKKNKKKFNGALDAVEKMPIEKWKYKDGVADEREHAGAYAEDFRRQTGLGDGKTINMIDAIGVAMKAVQELNQKVDKLKGEK